MGLINFAINNLEAYEPEGIFSFEFIDKNTQNTITEVFFLLPPESYSISCNYRVNVTKTLTDYYVDDFGNDAKDINISGSLYSYWFSTLPSLKNKRGISNFTTKIKNKATGFVQTIGSALQGNVAGVVSGGISLTDQFLGGLLQDKELSGLQEFFKLRYIIDRFRDKYDFRNIPRGIPGIAELEPYAAAGKKLYNDIQIIYHDYDDYNHYEVIIESFNFSKSKDDPFTMLYSIKMKGLDTHYPFGTLTGATGYIQKKEKPSDWLESLKTNITAELENSLGISAVQETAEIISQLADSIGSQQVAAATENFLNEVDRVKELYDVEIEDNESISKMNLQAEELTKQTNNYEDEIINNLGINYNDYLNGDIDIVDYENVKSLKTVNSLKLYSSQSKMSNKLVQDESQYNSINYKINSDDTLTKLSVKFFGAAGFEQLIGEINNINDKQLANIENEGKNIIIPIKNTDVATRDDNLIYYKKDYKKRDYNFFINSQLGIDISLPLEPTGLGNLKLISGENNFIEQTKRRFKWEKGSLNPINIFWGLKIPVGNIPTNLLIEKLTSYIIDQAKQDIRTKEIKIEDLIIKGSRIEFYVEIKNIATESPKSILINGE